jgi:hypothetical protein
LERLNRAPATVKELIAACRVSETTVRRGLLVLEKVGFHLTETVEKPVGRKYWQLKKPLQLPETDRQQYRTVAQLLRAQKVAHLDDKGLLSKAEFGYRDDLLDLKLTAIMFPCHRRARKRAGGTEGMGR